MPDAPDPLAHLADPPEVAAAIVEARAAIDGLLGHRMLRRRSAEVSAEAGLRGARASAALDGADRPLDDVRAGVDDPVVQGALRVATGIGPLLATAEAAPLQALARLHGLAARGLAPDSSLGRPRADDPALGPRLAGLAELMVRPRGSAVRAGGSALVLAAVVHGELLTLRPFGSADGVVARGAARLVLVGRGLDPKAVSVPEVGHVELGAGYPAAAAAYAAGDVATWLVHCAQAVALGAREGVAICEALVRTAEAG